MRMRFRDINSLQLLCESLALEKKWIALGLVGRLDFFTHPIANGAMSSFEDPRDVMGIPRTVEDFMPSPPMQPQYMMAPPSMYNYAPNQISGPRPSVPSNYPGMWSMVKTPTFVHAPSPTNAGGGVFSSADRKHLAQMNHAAGPANGTGGMIAAAPPRTFTPHGASGAMMTTTQQQRMQMMQYYYTARGGMHPNSRMMQHFAQEVPLKLGKVNRDSRIATGATRADTDTKTLNVLPSVSSSADSTTNTSSASTCKDEHTKKIGNEGKAESKRNATLAAVEEKISHAPLAMSAMDILAHAGTATATLPSNDPLKSKQRAFSVSSDSLGVVSSDEKTSDRVKIARKRSFSDLQESTLEAAQKKYAAAVVKQRNHYAVPENHEASVAGMANVHQKLPRYYHWPVYPASNAHLPIVYDAERCDSLDGVVAMVQKNGVSETNESGVSST
eukprot:g1675.t1